jgi:excisionase family DNA binding protein
MKTVQDVANALHIGEEQVRRWIRSGKLQAYKKDNCWTIKDEDFLIFLADRPKYNSIYFLETFGHKPPSKISKRAEKILDCELQQNKHGLKRLIRDINEQIGDS